MKWLILLFVVFAMMHTITVYAAPDDAAEESAIQHAEADAQAARLDAAHWRAAYDKVVRDLAACKAVSAVDERDLKRCRTDNIGIRAICPKLKRMQVRE